LIALRALSEGREIDCDAIAPVGQSTSIGFRRQRAKRNQPTTENARSAKDPA
jgi:hypothetical protein